MALQLQEKVKLFSLAMNANGQTSRNGNRLSRKQFQFISKPEHRKIFNLDECLALNTGFLKKLFYYFMECESIHMMLCLSPEGVD